MTTARKVIELDPTNESENPNYLSYTRKVWANSYASITNLNVRTTVDAAGVFNSNFEYALLPLYQDDERRLNEPATLPNVRSWRLETEADMENWWHTEVSNPVLSAWTRHPRIQQTCRTKPLTETMIPEEVDATYAMYVGNTRAPIVVGEMKRNLISREQWLTGRLTSPQAKLAQELRGYADKYECPQIFCWDGETLLLLQFQAQQLSDLRDPSCPVDCWILPRHSASRNCTLRYALYRFLAQGFRRCQTMNAPLVTVDGLTPSGREFYTGRPIWTVHGVHSIDHPLGCYRVVDPNSGALGGRNPQNDDDVTWETGTLW